MAHTEIIRYGQPQGWFSRTWQALRSYRIGAHGIKTAEDAKWWGQWGWGGAQTNAGIQVSEHSALNYSAVWAAVSIIAGDVASLPLILYKRTKDASGKDTGKVRYTEHSLYRVLHDEPNSEMTSFTFRETLTAHILTWGNAYAEIERNGAGQVAALWPLTPDRVSPFRQDGRLKYRVSNPTDRDLVFEAADILHVPGLGFDGTQGYGVITKARESIGLAIAAERFGGSFFGNNATFGGFLTYTGPGALSDKAKQNIRESLKERHAGPDKAWRLGFLEAGFDYKQTGIPPKDAHFLETRAFQIPEIARWFPGLPPHKLAHLDRATFSNIEQQDIDYYKSCLRRWLIRWEQEVNRKLISRPERNIQFAEHKFEGLLRGDSAARAEFYSKLFNVGVFSVNDIRELENLNPVPNGDERFIQGALVPLSRIHDVIDKQVEPTPQPAAQAPSASDESLQAEKERADRAEQAAADARAEATKEREARIAAEAFGAATAQELEIRRQAETDAHAKATQLEVLAAELRAQHQASVEAHEAQAADAERRLTEATADVARLQTAVAEKEAALASERAALALVEARAADLTRQTTEADAQLAEADQRHRDAVARLEVAEALAAERGDKLTEAGAAVDRLLDDVQAAREEVGVAEVNIREARAARDEADAKRQQADEAVTLLTARIAETEAKHAAAVDAVAIAEVARDEAQQLAEARQAELAARSAELETERTARQEAEAALVAQRNADAARMVRVIASHRELFARVFGRMVRREVANAKRYQATPQKLRAWLESYYDEQERDLFASELTPIVALHLEWTGSTADPAVVTQTLVQQHIEESQRALQAVVEAGPEGFQELLQRTLHRWETERVARVADRLMTEEITHHVRSA